MPHLRERLGGTLQRNGVAVHRREPAAQLVEQRDLGVGKVASRTVEDEAHQRLVIDEQRNGHHAVGSTRHDRLHIDGYRSRRRINFGNKFRFVTLGDDQDAKQ